MRRMAAQKSEVRTHEPERLMTRSDFLFDRRSDFWILIIRILRAPSAHGLVAQVVRAHA